VGKNKCKSLNVIIPPKRVAFWPVIISHLSGGRGNSTNLCRFFWITFLQHKVVVEFSTVKDGIPSVTFTMILQLKRGWNLQRLKMEFQVGLLQ
jgi:hypothetical protein